MKKQIAVLMAAATAVTTVAPAIANADVNNHKDVSVNEAVEKARKALNDKYDNSKANGITLPTGSSLAKDYLSSKYIVLVGVKGKTSDKLEGFDRFDKSAYKDFSEYTAEVADGVTIANGVIKGNYEVNDKTTINENNWYIVDNATKLGTILEANDDAVVSIIDKGSKDGSSVRTTTKKHYVSGMKLTEDDQTVTLNKLTDDLYNAAAEDETYVESLKVTDTKGETYKIVDDKIRIAGNPTSYSKEISKVELKLASDVEITLEVNDDALDLKEARDKNGNVIKLDTTNTQDVLDKVASFELLKNKDDLSVDLDINNGDTEVYTVDSKAIEESLELNNIYTREDGYTSEGKDFVNGLVNAKTNEKNTFNFRGTNYQVIIPKGVNYSYNPITNSYDSITNVKEYMNKVVFRNAVIDKSGDGYKLTFNLRVRDANDKAVKKTLKFVVKGDSQRDLYDVLRDLKGSIEVVSGHFTKLAGSNRYATAIAVSEEQFKPDTAKSVVIVGGKAQLDGLAAAPLASAKNAPILLADPNTGLNRDTIKEIDRACESLKDKTVYIVGGEKSVPAKVVKQLEDEFGAVVERVAGSNRKTTSLEVAKRLNRDKLANKRVFVVGGEGAADAMSVSAVASIKNNEFATKPKAKDKRVSPILVVDAKGVERDTREFLVKDMRLARTNMKLTEIKNDGQDEQVGQVRLIGGEKSLNTQVLRDLKTTARITDTARISGDNRYDTNVNVIEAFYENSESDETKIVADGAIFASGENAYLVDAQTAGSFAANNNLPIVLAGNKLTNDQIDLMKKDGVLESKRSNIYQVGGVVSSDVMKVVVDKLDL